jgi:hypothetical protein
MFYVIRLPFDGTRVPVIRALFFWVLCSPLVVLLIVIPRLVVPLIVIPGF